MKYEFTQKETKGDTFPKLMKSKHSDMLVLCIGGGTFDSYFSGLSLDTCSFSDMYDRSSFEEVKGTLTLTFD